MNPQRRWALALLVVLCLALVACAGPVGTVRSDPKDVLRDLARSATTTGEPNLATRNALHVFGLFETYEESPEVAIEQLHRVMVASQGHPALLFALAELSYLYGELGRQAGVPHGGGGVRVRLSISGG